MEIVHRDQVTPEQRAQWDRLCQDAVLAMKTYCLPFVTPISRELSPTEGQLQGTGGFIEFGGRRLLITNEHVVRAWKSQRFSYQLPPCETLYPLVEPLGMERPPVDAAIYDIPDARWQDRAHHARPVPESHLAERHAPVPGELLFFCGFPEARSEFWYGTLISRATPLLTQEHRSPPTEGVHPATFVMPYSPEKAQFVEPGGAPLALPPGLSGSLVWNTRLIECMSQHREWTPDQAQVTGLLSRWDSSTSTVFAVRIEVLRDVLRRIQVS